MDICDNTITLNKGGNNAAFVGAGINIEANGDTSAGYIHVSSDQAKFAVRLPSLAGGVPQIMATKES